jgi:hypothetical protein
MFVRIAGDRQAMSPLKTSDHQHLRVEGIHHVAEEEARVAGKDVEWSAVREEVEALLTQGQVARVEQLVVQRLGYRVFFDSHVAQRLQLTREQQEEISSRVEQYRFLVRDNQAELGRAWHRAAKLLDGEELASRIKDLTAQKFARDHVFLLQLWSGFHCVLSEQQRQDFDAMRGPMPESLRAILPRLRGNPGFAREGKTICYRRRGSLPAKAMAVDINPPSDQDVQLAWWELRHDNGYDVEPDEVRQLRIIKEKLVDFIDPPRVFPKVGRARLHHAHYKCTVWSGEDEVDAVYLDRTHFHGVAEGEYDARCELTEDLIRIPVEQPQRTERSGKR